MRIGTNWKTLPLILALSGCGECGCGKDALGPSLLSKDCPVQTRAPLALELASPDGQQAVPGAAVAQAPTVRATAVSSANVAGIEVTFAIAAGGGQIGSGQSSVQILTNSQGLASTPWTLGLLGENRVTAEITKYDPKVFAVAANHTVSISATAVPPVGNNLLVNGGFESSVLTGSPPNAAGYWRGDLVESTLPPAGFTAYELTRILRFIATGNVSSTNTEASQLWQIIDVTAFAALIDQGGLRADGEVFFNRVDGTGVDSLFALDIMAFDGVPGEFPAKFASGGWLAHRTVELKSDGLPATWERVAASLTLPSGTRYVAVQIYAFEDVVNDGSGTPEFAGHYADGASLKLVRP